MNKNKLVSRFIIGTFVSLYALVSIVSTIHVIDFFELSNPRWLAITLAIGFEIGAAASLASLIILDKMNKTIVIKIILIILFLICLLDMPYGYYQFVRFTGMIGFGLLAFENYHNNQTWFVIWISSALLINPFFKIALGRDMWNIIDVIWAVLLIVSMILNKRD